MSTIFTHYADLMIPGMDQWPCYSKSATEIFWKDWRQTSPFSTQIALAFCMLVIVVYCNVNRLAGSHKTESLAKMESSSIFLFRQSFLMLKTMACMAYFSDPEVFKLASAHSSMPNQLEQ